MNDVFIWQGYHHEWEYNHRLNRFGSYVRHADGRPIAGHTAASGTGADVAHFTEFVTAVQAEGVGFQAGMAETIVECPRTDHTPFRIDLRGIPLEQELRDKDNLTVIINGFDLVAQDHADKLISFDLEVTDPVVYNSGEHVRFNILGSLCVDCRSPECQLLPLRLEVEDIERPNDPPLTDAPVVKRMPHNPRGIQKHRVDRAAQWLKKQIVRLTNLEEVKATVIGADEDTLRRRIFRAFGKRFYLKFLKWRITTPYILRVHYVIIAGDEADLAITEPAPYESSYTWDIENEIDLDSHGTQPIHIKGHPPDDYAVNLVAFKHLSMSVALDPDHGAGDPVQWGKGMHFLNWSMALRNTTIEGETVRSNLDMFYKCWSAEMNEVITLTTWGAVRSAGSADLKAGVVLLQMREGRQQPDIALPGFISWPGGGLSARNHPRAIFERAIMPEVIREPTS